MNFLTWLSRHRFRYDPLIQVEISKNRLIHNLHEFKKLAPKDAHGRPQIAPVLKSNAYGHGLYEVAHIIEREAKKNGGIPFCIVDSYFEAIALRAKGFKLPLLVIGYTRTETMRNSNLKDVAFAITSIETLRRIAVQKIERWPSTGGRLGFRSARLRLRPKMLHVHLKIDTGMRRQGIMIDEIEEAIGLLKNDGAGRRPVVLEGICSHLSDADNDDESFSESQIHIWNKAAARFREEFKDLRYMHLSATDGHRLTHDVAANVSRLGIGLYGISQNQSLARRLELLPALEMKTIVTSIKTLKEGETAGYGNTFKARSNIKIATVPVGYYEGIDRRLSSGTGGVPNGYILVGPGRVPCPIVGRVSMNITAIDISGVPDAHIGMQAIAISNIAAEPNSISNIAQACETISYEIAVHIPAHLKRVVV